jgi:uncharacterized phiE125 gp8 family phage protein
VSRVITGTVSTVTPSLVAPLDLQYVRKHVRAVTDVEDDLLEGMVLAARDYWEEQTGRSIMQTVFDYWLDGFPMPAWSAQTRILLPKPPLVSVESVAYTDSGGTDQEFTDGASPATNLYVVGKPVGLYASPGWVVPASGEVWPIPEFSPGAVRIRFTAGYAETADEVPAIIKAQLLMLVGAMDQFRSEVHYSEGARVEKVPLGILDLTAFKYTNTQVLRSAWP